MAHIPGLGTKSFAVGSWHSAATPTLLRSDVSATGFSFEWSATGTQVYTVKASGALRQSAAAPGGTLAEALCCTCTCPDGARQALATETLGKLYVCKHGAAALNSVLDPAVKAEEATQEATQRQLAAQQAATLAAERVKQDAEMPGERARIEQGLTKRKAKEVVAPLFARLRTLEGLRAAVAFFPPEFLPPPSTQHCRRCGMDYDVNIPSQLVCRVEHTYTEGSRRWEDSKHSYDECSKCGGAFNLDGYSSLGRRKRGDPVDSGPFCWEGAHKASSEPDSDEDEEGDEFC